MKFKMNERNWEIKEVSKQFLDEKYATVEDGEMFGITDYQEQIIYLWEELHKEQKRQTLIHELVHCYIGCYMSFEDMEWHQDVICNMVANSHDIIHRIVEDYVCPKIKIRYTPEDFARLVDDM